MTSYVHDTPHAEGVKATHGPFTTYPLEGLLPKGYTVTLFRPDGILMLSTSDPARPIAGACMFTVSEMCVLVPLLQEYPHYAPYETLLAHFTRASPSVTEEVIEQCRRHLHAALREGVFEHEMRPVRNVMSRTRLKLHGFGIEVRSLLETGYVLMPRPVGKKRVLRQGARVSA